MGEVEGDGDGHERLKGRVGWGCRKVASMEMHKVRWHRDGDGHRDRGTHEGRQSKCGEGRGVLRGGGSGDVDNKMREGGIGRLPAYKDTASKRIRIGIGKGSRSFYRKKGLYVYWFGDWLK